MRQVIALLVFICISARVFTQQNPKGTVTDSITVTEAVIVSAVRASQNTPATFSTIPKEEIERKNLSQDLPYLLSNQPSVVATSDAGNGVGYTGLRIRGSDITRINVTINGIPLNDPESHAVYWVDIPDFASSVNSLQLQRGVGSSTNGAGAFGASMNLETNTIQTAPSALISASAGSFGTYKTTFQAGTGLIKNHWFFDGRASMLGSDGYVDRASSRLSSFFIQGGYKNEKTIVKAITFGGNEKTYQSWYGIDPYTMKTDRTFNWAGVIFNDDGTMSFYKNQTDNYRQNHYQLHVSHQFTARLSMNISGHYTFGRGYYEEYMQDQNFSDYGLPDLYVGKDSLFQDGQYTYFYHDTLKQTDLIRRRWLDNQYYGTTWSVHHHTGKTDLVLGGAWNKYDHARHYGEIIWAQYSGNQQPDKPYYDNTGFKTDFNVFLKAGWTPVKNLTLYGDAQYRDIIYQAHGIENEQNEIHIDETFRFFNPKVGLSYSSKAGTLYASYGIAHREPNRDDFTGAAPGEKPRAETLGDLEAGVRKTASNFNYAINYFLMNYHDQLVLTGEINEDGDFIRKNAGKSYRTGIEMMGGYQPNRYVEFDGNLSFMRSRTDYKEQESEGGIKEYKNVTISFSPSVTGGAEIRVHPVKDLEVSWEYRYVSRQYLDNTENKELSLDPYSLNDVLISYRLSGNEISEVEFSLMVNNILNKSYESNGYVYDGAPYYYPQAGTHFMAGVTFRF
jgi:iron complex outermembrane recepter protein